MNLNTFSKNLTEAVEDEYVGFDEFCAALDQQAQDDAMIADYEAINPDGCYSDALEHLTPTFQF